MAKVLNMECVKDLCVIQQMLEETETIDVCGVTSWGGVHLTVQGFKALFGQGQTEAYPIDDQHTHKHFTYVDNVKVFCIGGEIL